MWSWLHKSNFIYNFFFLNSSLIKSKMFLIVKTKWCFNQVHKKAPEGVPVEINARCLAFDGDADRLVYYYIDDSKVFHLLDGDKIATLLADYLIELIRKANVDINLGLVQTAYANGSSTNYVKNTLASFQIFSFFFFFSFLTFFIIRIFNFLKFSFYLYRKFLLLVVQQVLNIYITKHLNMT